MSSSVTMRSSTSRKRRDYRVNTIVLIIIGCILLGYVIHLLPGKGVSSSLTLNGAVDRKFDDLSSLQVEPLNNKKNITEELVTDPENRMLSPEQKAIQEILDLAQQHINKEQFDLAIATLHVSREKLKDIPSAYFKMGQALEGQKKYDVARDFYSKTTDMDPYFADAYFGFATTSESLGDLESAIGGMRNFLHAQPNADLETLKFAQARSAIWEWESQLGRGPWGPTKGIPPGLTAEQIKRDGNGVAGLMPIRSSKRPDGSMDFVIRHVDKKQVFKK